MKSSINIKFTSEFAKTIYQDGRLLKYQTEGSSGFDIRAIAAIVPNEEPILLSKNEFILKPQQRVCIQVGFAISMTNDYELQIRPRSGLAFKNGITIVNTPGTIDSDYRGEIGAILLNSGCEDFIIKAGDRIAQAVIMKVEKLYMNFTDGDLDCTERSEGRFGSTGNN
jgi:dUTP pyrophosphatase